MRSERNEGRPVRLGLVGALQGKGPLTVFAPTDAAFAKLGKQAIEDLLQPKNRDRLAAKLADKK